MKSLKDIVGEMLYPIMQGKQTPYSVMVNDSGQNMVKIKSKVLYNNPVINAELACLVAEYYGVLPVIFQDAYNCESYAIGQKINYSDYGVPDNDQDDPLIKSEADFDKIQWPDDPLKSGNIPQIIEAMELLTKYTGIPTTVYNGIASPFSVACAICSFKAVLNMMRRNPDLLHKLLTKITDDITMPYVKAIAGKYPGAEIWLADAWEVIPNISPKKQKEFGFTYFERTMEKAKDFNCSINFYNSYGEKYFEYPKVYLKEKLKYTSTIYLSGTENDKVPYSAYHDVVLETGTKMMACISAKDIYDGPPERIVEKVRKLVKETRSGIDSSKYMLVALGGSASQENIMAVIDAYRAFSILPVPDDYDSIEVKLTSITETFGEFIKRKAKENPDSYTFKWLDQVQI